jgi:glycosyltransferase involved in cell wall biosynthesis
MLLTSSSEGLPVTVLEAMIRSIPVVAPRIDGIPEAVADNSTGLLVNGDGPNGYVEALSALAGDRGLCRQLGIAGKERAATRFGLQLHLRNLMNHYRSLFEASIDND